MARFDVLTAQRAIRSNSNLSGPQLGLLLCATLRADDSRKAEPGRVRASLELLAKDAKVASRTAERAFKEPEVLRYFAKVERQTRSVGLWFHPTTDAPDSGLSVWGDSGLSVGSGGPTPDSLSTTPDTKSDHLPTHLKTASSKEADMADDLATWLAAELDADPAACTAAITAKQRQAESKGNPWRSPATMVKQTIPLDEWRPLVARSAPAPKRVTLAQCDGREPHGSHRWEDSRNLFHCQGVDHDQLAPVGT